VSPLQRDLPDDYRRHLERRDHTAGDHASGVTLRAILIGCGLAALIAIGVPYGSMVIQGSRLGLSSATSAAFFLLFVLLLTLHLCLGLLNRAWAFGRGELLTIFAMMMVATAIPTRGVVGMLLPMVTGTFYYATPENQWADLIHPHLASWMVVSDQEAISAFYEGQGRGAQIPWRAWLLPLGSWLLFYAAFYLTLISLMSILRRQWVDTERLAYPLAQVPLAMIQGDKLLKPFFRNRLMWLGLAIPFVIGSFEALHHYFPAMPSPTLQTRLTLLRESVSLRIGLNFLMLGFAYLIGIQLSFSLWVFYLLHALQEGLLRSLHLHHIEELGQWSDPGMGHQMMGAFAVFVGYGLWTARAHLADVGRKVLRPGGEEDEMASYRFCVGGLLLGASCMVWWLWRSGLPLWIAALVVVAALCILVALARIVAEAGTPTITPGMIPAGFTVSAVGVPALGAKGMVALGYTCVWIGDLLVFMTAPLANGLRLGSELGGDRRGHPHQPRRIHLVHPAPGLYPRRGKPPLAILYRLCCHPLQIRRAETAPSHRSRSHRLALDRRGRPVDGRADFRPQPLGLVAFTPHRLCREHGVGHGPYLVLNLPRLADQSPGFALRGCRPLPQNRAVFSRRRPRPDRRRRLLAFGRRLYRHGGQPPARLLSFLVIAHTTQIPKVCSRASP
jgi:hypothetical protein